MYAKKSHVLALNSNTDNDVHTAKKKNRNQTLVSTKHDANLLGCFVTMDQSLMRAVCGLPSTNLLNGLMC